MPKFVAGYLSDPEDQQCILRELRGGPEWVEWDRGTMDIPAIAEAVTPRLPGHLRDKCTLLLERWMADSEPMPGMEALVRALKAAGYGIYLLSNTATTFYGYRDKIPAIEVFDGEFISADCHLLKPHKDIYDAFTEKFGLAPETCFFIDDKTENIAGAKAAGWDGFAFTGDVGALESALRAAGVEWR